MKIINREQFLKLPRGVLYAKYAPCYFENLAIKDEYEHFINDWYFQELIEIETKDNEDFSEVLFRAEETGESIGLDYNCVSRDGLYEENQLFAVFEKEDVINLIKLLQNSVSKYPESI